MAIKYECPKCGRRFVDWGAKKLDFKCPDCANETLVKAGTSAKPHRAPSLKRTSAKAAVSVSAALMEEDETLVPDFEEVADEDVEEDVEVFGEDDEVDPVHGKRAVHPAEVAEVDETVVFVEGADEDEDEADAEVDAPVDLGFSETIGTSLGEGVPEPDLDESYD